MRGDQVTAPAVVSWISVTKHRLRLGSLPAVQLCGRPVWAAADAGATGQPEPLGADDRPSDRFGFWPGCRVLGRPCLVSAQPRAGA